MLTKPWVIAAGYFLTFLLLAACSQKPPTSISNENAGLTARFAGFDYAGDDEVFRIPLDENNYQNPILTGFHPDPNVVRVDQDYYMVHSTFGFFPGIPIFHSTDLVNWTQIGNAIHRPEQLNYQGLPLTNGGIYAPAINHRDGIFYVISTCAGCGGNFVVTASDPAGPWSDPLWMPHLHGIDPSIFFDDDGKTYVAHHRNPDNPRYMAHTALWVMEVDLKTFEALSDDVMLIDGGDESPWNTDYIEGPHIYKVDGTYYLSAAGGGTGYYHNQLLYKSDHIFGPYTANPNNPVLTQYGLPDDRPHPVTATGHADMFQDSNGDWWSVFLATRVYDLDTPPQDPGNFHTGRETFMLPVTWQDGWPVILEPGKAVPYQVKRPNLPAAEPAVRAMTGNFSLRENFTDIELAPHWLFARAPTSRWWSKGKGELVLDARPDFIGELSEPSFIGRRLAHIKATYGTTLYFSPQTIEDEAGLLAVQSDEFFYAFGLGKNTAGDTVLRVRQRAGESYPERGVVLIEKTLEIPADAPVYLRTSIDKSRLDFAYSLDGNTYHQLLENADSTILTSAVAGGFVGAVVGMYAEGQAVTASD